MAFRRISGYVDAIKLTRQEIILSNGKDEEETKQTNEEVFSCESSRLTGHFTSSRLYE